ncbi:hypothetical protein NFI96_032285 [Prochilodus magdalenae]|nr:hypothetical protein NFI96_032285 [Prochilodus magdalenae]
MHVMHICLSSCSNGSLCQCGGERDSHASVTLSDYFSSAIVSHWESAKHSSEAPTDAFGEVEFAGASKRHSYLEHPHTVPADGAVGVEVEGHQAFWTCDNRPFISVLTTVPPHTDLLGVSTKTKAGLSCTVQPSANGANRRTHGGHHCSLGVCNGGCWAVLAYITCAAEPETWIICMSHDVTPSFIPVGWFLLGGAVPLMFLRLSWDTPAATAYNIMTTHWGLPKPNLVLSVAGGVGRSKGKTWVREVLRQGLVKAAQSTGAWILSRGLREGVGRFLGEAVRDHATAASSDSLTKVVAIGIAPWGLVENRQQLVNSEGSFPAEYYVSNTSRDYNYLDNNYQAFLLVDDGSVGRKGGEAGFRAHLENYISHQRTGKFGSGTIDIPVLCILVSGEAYMLERLDLSLKNCIPWLVLAGSGGLADLVSDVLENVSILPAGGAEGEGEAAAKMNLRETVAKGVAKHFPSAPDMDKLVDKVGSIT